MDAAAIHEEGLGTLVTFNPIAVRSDETLDELAERLRSSGYHHWPVVDDGRRLLGIVSDSDVVRHYAARLAAQELRSGGSGGEMNEVYAEDVMSTRVINIDMRATKVQALERMLDHEIHSLPVVDRDLLVGIVTSTDFLREFSEGNLPGHRDPVSRRMTKTLETVESDATLDVARMELMVAGMHYLPVTMGECPLGVISQRMLRASKCRHMLERTLSTDGQAAEPTITDLVKSAPTIKPGERLAKAASLMVEYSVQAIAVVSQGSKLFGVISEDEILRTALKELRKGDNEY